MLTLILFLLILGVLVFVHELGHFAVAKWTGMRVDEFALGFPPRIFAWKKGETTYALNAVPFGGYVKIRGEAPDSEEADPRAFNNKSVWARIAVIVAGVTMNVLFAFVVLTIAFSVGFSSYAQDLSKIPGAVVKSSQVVAIGTLDGSPAAKAGIKPGDVITGFKASDGSQTKVSNPEQMIAYTQSLQAAGTTTIQVEYLRDGASKEVRSDVNPTGAALGVSIASDATTRVPVWRAPGAAFKEMGFIFRLTWDTLGQFAHKLFFSAQLDPSVSGPVGIYQATGQARQQGTTSLIFLLVALSLNLALLNILPIPALDGGRLFFLIIELIFGKKAVNVRVESAVTFAGFVVVMGCIVLLSARDLWNIFM
jgi:regulator of sigma E protease